MTEENEAEIIFEYIIPKSFPNLKNDINTQIHEYLAWIQE